MSLSRLLFLLWFAGLASCGFQMRGAKSVPSEMQRTYIDASDQRSIFYRKLRSRLEANGIELVESAGNATAVLTIMSDVTDQRVISVSARNVPREFEVFYTVQYELNTPDATLVPARTQTVTRDYTYDETLVLGKASEETVLRNAIADDLVRIVMIQLTSL